MIGKDKLSSHAQKDKLVALPEKTRRGGREGTKGFVRGSNVRDVRLRRKYGNPKVSAVAGDDDNDHYANARRKEN